jgi:hypothetical protein
MRRLLFLAALLPLLLGCQQAEETAAALDSDTLEPYGTVVAYWTFQGGKRAAVIVSGNGATPMGLYVLDADGNCVASDDHGNAATKDDLAAEWFPRANGLYKVEVRNFGGAANAYRYRTRGRKEGLP